LFGLDSSGGRVGAASWAWHVEGGGVKSGDAGVDGWHTKRMRETVGLGWHDWVAGDNPCRASLVP
jgi:hypothetical protein